MAWSHWRAYKSMERHASEVGLAWAQDPHPDVSLDLRRVLMQPINEVMEQIDLSEREWDLERQFGDADYSLVEHAVWMSRLYRNKALTDAYNANHRPVDVTKIKELLAEGLRKAGVWGEGECLNWSDLDSLIESFAKELGAAWVLRGGVELSALGSIALMIFAEFLALAVRPESTYSYGDDGMPQRVQKDVIAAVVESNALHLTGEEVNGRLPFVSRSWEDFDVDGFFASVVEVASVAILARRATASEAAAFEAEIASADASLVQWQKKYHRPLVSPFGLNPDEAEVWIGKWMLHMGARGAAVTQYVGDGGIDVEAEKYIAQVKMYAGSVGIASIREFAGVSFMDASGRRPLFFTTGRYPQSAPELADRANMALFYFDLATGAVSGANRLGELYSKHGFLADL